MKRRHAVTTLAALALIAVGSLFAATASAEDTMKPETTKPESGGMNADTTKPGDMESDTMKPDDMDGDAMGGAQE